MLYCIENPHANTHYSFQLANTLNVPWILNAEIYNDSVDKIINISEKKIVLLQWWMTHDIIADNHDYSWADLIICSTGEIINKPWNEYVAEAKTLLNNQNIIFISSGYWRSSPDPKYSYTALLEWFDRVVAANDYIPARVDIKPYLFDALLGQNRYHRSYVFNQLKNSGLLDQSLVSLTPDLNSQIEKMKSECYESPNLYQYDDINTSQSTWEEKSSYRLLNTHQYKFGLPQAPTMSVLIPKKIYDASWYSIVCETQYEDGLFLTEKTAKPIYAKRIFVLFGCPGQLEFLRSQGFQTFDSIIDESYDTITNTQERFVRAWQTVVQLANSNPTEIYSQAQSILEHNYNVLVDIKSRQKKVQDFILPFLP